MTPSQEEAIAFNLCSLHGFDPDFVSKQRGFALAVIKEYERSRPARIPPALDEKAAGEPVVWHRLGDVIPDRALGLLIAIKRVGEDFWSVRDANLYLRHEGAFASVHHLKDGAVPHDWWFDSIYPGKGDHRLAREDLLWAYMPTPAALKAETEA